ncbi:MAG: polysaccharide lyase [Chromatiales bacterium]|nr:polysaccharide lyase [Chromatiales bacterium]
MKYISTLLIVLFAGQVSAYQAYIDNENAFRIYENGNNFWIDDLAENERYLISHANGSYLPTRYTSLSRKGESSVKIQIPSSRDNINNSSYSYNRSEIVLGNALPLEQEHWVKFSVFLQSQFPDPDDWFCFFQVWQKDAGNPLLGLFLTTEGRLKVNIKNNDYPSGAGLDLYTDQNQIHKGKWIDFVIGFRGSLDTDGHLKIWRKLSTSACYESIVDVDNINIGKTYLPSTNEIAQELEVYPKFGIYRGGSDLNHQMWFDEIKYNETGPLFYNTPPLCP